MYIKIMAKPGAGGQERLIEREEILSEEHDDHLLVILKDKGVITDQIRVPHDSPVVYVCNQLGRTIRPFFWPPKKHEPFPAGPNPTNFLKGSDAMEVRPSWPVGGRQEKVKEREVKEENRVEENQTDLET